MRRSGAPRRSSEGSVPHRFATTFNGQRIAEAEVPLHAADALRRAVIEVCEGGARLVALFARPLDRAAPAGRRFRLYAVLADDFEGRLAIAAADLVEPRYSALTPHLPEAHWFERELHELHGIEPEGHPWLKP